MKKTYILLFLAVFMGFPTTTHAVRIGNIFDPICLFSWRDGCKDNITVDNSINGSFNVNSNINSPGGVISGNNGSIITSPTPVISGPVYYYDTPQPIPRPTPTPVYSSLSVSCSVNSSSINKGDSVRWSAYASGGNGSYSYDWSGSESLDGGGSTVSIRYGYTGNKYASVTVNSGNQSITRSCGNVDVRDDYYEHNYNNYNNYNNNYDYNRNYYNNDNYISVQCYPDTYRSTTGISTVWRAVASGGTGYYNYSWSGTDGISGYNSDVSYIYSRTGTKYASVSVRSGNRTTTQSCGTITVDQGINNYYYSVNTYSGALDVTCSANISRTTTGKVVTWTAYPTGGNGLYTYTWSGSDGFTGGQKTVVTSYSSVGSKSALVTVYSAGQNVSRSCGTTEIVYGSITSHAPKPANITKARAPSIADAFSAIPWVLVSIVVIFVLFCTVMYLLLSKKN